MHAPLPVWVIFDRVDEVYLPAHFRFAPKADLSGWVGDIGIALAMIRPHTQARRHKLAAKYLTFVRLASIRLWRRVNTAECKSSLLTRAAGK